MLSSIMTTAAASRRGPEAHTTCAAAGKDPREQPASPPARDPGGARLEASGHGRAC
jgi:hypothetical protein